MFTLQLPTVHSTNGTDLPNVATTTRTLKKPRTRAGLFLPLASATIPIATTTAVDHFATMTVGTIEYC
jgi:hypothetical protein